MLAALRHRDATGEGQHIDMALLDVQVASMINVAQAYLSAGLIGRRNGNEHPSVVPSQAFPCADGTLMVAAANNTQFARLCEVLGRAELAHDPRYATNHARVRNRAELKRILQSEFDRDSVAVWVQRLVAAGIPAGPINDMAQVFQDPQVISRGMRIELDHATSGRLPLLASPMKLSATPPGYALPPPVLGEHTDAVLSGLLRMPAAEIAALRRSGVIE
jgi:crotonobetainyl-CoA:carnitine CoA-transferase CaiB-like acyl-CoA transferase